MLKSKNFNNGIWLLSKFSLLIQMLWTVFLYPAMRCYSLSQLETSESEYISRAA